ncbi:hypothetical protein JB92DRAFT_2920908 [Gautieria morchelliformis]|nr:hypothetical protein JB92DRAFT_2920908 [Gautieria morchelliformis]
MHLFLHRPGQGDLQTSTDADFGPYISILPECFDGHPLSWLISSSRGDPQDVAFLLDCLPPATQKALDVMAIRFWKDWNVVSQILVNIFQSTLINHDTIRAVQRQATSLATSGRHHTTPLIPSVTEEHVETYLWAWLNVNTRCVYHRVSPSPSHPDNLTLCPLLDLANHTSSSAHASPRTPIPTFYSPSTSQLNKGDEVYLRYGPHSNVTLFTEYGFVEENPSNGGQLDVSDILELLFRKKGPLGAWMKTALEATNYWGNWTLHDTPGPAHPSYRLLPALRLLQLSPQLSPGTSSNDPTYDSPELKVWHETILGEKDFVSSDNERTVWQQLLEICEIVAKRSEEGLDRLQQACRGKDLDGWRAYAVKAIRILWLEERRVSIALMQSIESGQAVD